MIEFLPAMISVCGLFIVACGAFCLKDKYYRDYYETKPHYYHYQQSLNDSSYSPQHICCTQLKYNIKTYLITYQ